MIKNQLLLNATKANYCDKTNNTALSAFDMQGDGKSFLLSLCISNLDYRSLLSLSFSVWITKNFCRLDIYPNVPSNHLKNGNSCGSFYLKHTKCSQNSHRRIEMKRLVWIKWCDKIMNKTIAYLKRLISLKQYKFRLIIANYLCYLAG